MRAEFPEKLQFLFEPLGTYRYRILYGGRGGTKSWGFARAQVILGATQPLRFLDARETQKSIDESVHHLLAGQIRELELHDFYDIQQKTILGKNPSTNAILNGRQTQFVFAGLKHNVANIKSLEDVDVLWVEEAQDTSKDSWETIIPTIRKDPSEIWASYNPKLDTDETHVRFVVRTPPRSKVVKIGWQDNPWFPESLRVEKDYLKEVDYAAYLNVWEGECRSSVEGAIYANELKQATEQGRIGSTPYNRARPVDTVWDLGYGDLTAIWFCQSYDGYFHFIDYLEGDGLTIADYLVQLQNKGYLYGTDWIPFDGVDTIIHKKLAGDRSMSIEQLMRAAGRSVRIVPKVLIGDRINAARTIFPQCRFDAERCADGIQALRHFQWGPLNDHGVRKREPLHNWASHAAESFTRAGQALRQPKAEVKKVPAVVPRPVRSGDYAPFG